VQVNALSPRSANVLVGESAPTHKLKPEESATHVAASKVCHVGLQFIRLVGPLLMSQKCMLYSVILSYICLKFVVQFT
jgi:type IV secretory pathway VirB6-like protein